MPDTDGKGAVRRCRWRESIRGRRAGIQNPREYAEVLAELGKMILPAKPNAAHLGLAEYQVPIITMNIDGLHRQAGSLQVINVHGDWPDIVLYEDPAPRYQEAFGLLMGANSGDCLLVIGASESTYFAVQMRYWAKEQGLRVVEIQEQAAVLVPEFLKAYYQETEKA